MKKLYVDTRRKENKLSPSMTPYNVYPASDVKLYEGQNEYVLLSDLIDTLKDLPEALKIIESI